MKAAWVVPLMVVPPSVREGRLLVSEMVHVPETPLTW